MSRSNGTALCRQILAAGILVAALAVPVASHAQAIGGERALLNHTHAASGAVAARALRLALGISPAEPVDGARALLAPIAASANRDPVLTDFPAPARVDGDRALLGVWARESRRAALSARR